MKEAMVSIHRPYGGHIRRWLSISREEIGPTVLRSSYLFFLMVSFMASKSFRDATFLASYGAERLPQMYILLSILLAGGTVFYNRILGWFGSRAVFNLSLVGTLCIQVAFVFLYRSGHTWVPLAYYLFVAAYGILIAQFWLYVSWTYNIQEAKRLLLPVGSGGISGAIVGGLLVRYMAESLPVYWLGIVAAGAIGMCLCVCPFLWRGFGPRDTHLPGQLHLDALSTFLKNGYLVKILSITALVSMVGILVEYQFNVMVQGQYRTAARMASFFGSFYLLSGAGALAAQFFLARPLLRRTGLLTVANLLPMGLFVGASFLIVMPFLWVCFAVRLWDGIFRHSLYKISWEILYLPLAEADRIRSKIFLDTMAPKASEGLAGALLIVIVDIAHLPLYVLSMVVSLLSAVAVGMGLSMRKEYVRKLKENMESDRSQIERARFDYSDRTTLSILAPYLRSMDPVRVVTAIRVLGNMNRLDVMPRDLLMHPDAVVKKEALRWLTRAGEKPDPEWLRSLFHHPDTELAAEAFRVFARFYPFPHDEIRSFLLVSERIELRTVGAELLASHPEQGCRNRAYEVLRSMAHSMGEAGVPKRVAAARAMGNIGRNEYAPLMIGLLGDDSPLVVQEAMLAAGRGRYLHAVFHLIDSLRLPRRREYASRALALYGRRIVGTLYDSLHDEAGNFRSRFQIPLVLGKIGGADVVDLLQGCLATAYPLIRHRIVRVLNGMFRRDPSLRLHKSSAFGLIEDQIRRHFLLLQVRYILRTKDWGEEPLVLRVLDEQVELSQEIIFGLLNLAFVKADFARVLFSLRSRNEMLQAWAREFVDTEVKGPGSLVEPLRLLLEDLPEQDKVRRSARLYGLKYSMTPEEVLEALCRYPDHWLVSCALYALHALDLRLVFYRIRDEVDLRSVRIRDTIASIEESFQGGSENPMLSIVEKVLAMEGYELFHELTSDQLSRIAELTTEISYGAGDRIFGEEESADAMYFILKGRVVLKHKGEVVGGADAANRWLEGMRILSGTPRGVTAEAVEPCDLLRLSQEDLFSLLYDSPEISIRLIRVLAQAMIDVRLHPQPGSQPPPGHGQTTETPQ